MTTLFTLTIQLSEPASEEDRISRLRRAEEFLRDHLAGLCLQELPDRCPKVAWHFMRYLDPTDIPDATGIVVMLKLLGETGEAQTARDHVNYWLLSQAATVGITTHDWKGPSDWAAENHQAYGGPPTAKEFAQFLQATSVIALKTLAPASRPQRDIVLQNWRHCMNLITVGYDWALNGPPSIESAAA